MRNPHISRHCLNEAQEVLQLRRYVVCDTEKEQSGTQNLTTSVSCVRIVSALLTATPDVDAQAAVNNSAVLEGLCSIHRVDVFPVTHLVAQAMTSTAEHTEERE